MNIIDEPENHLEHLLRLAATEPGHRPEFYKVLMQSSLYVLGEAEGDLTDGEPVPEDSEISLLHWEKPDGSTIIPVFTSLQAMQESIDDDESYLELAAATLFEMTAGEELIMNPDSEYGKVFTAAEIDALLNGNLHQAIQQRVLGQADEVMIGQPDPYPVQLVDSLTTLFSKHANVDAAYLGVIEEVDREQPPNLIIGLLGKGDLEAVISEAGAVAWDTIDEEEFVDFIIIERDDDGIGAYFLSETTPFYESRWGSKIEPYTEPGKA